MNHTLRALAAGTLLTALVVAAVTAYPALAHDGEADVWHAPDWRVGFSEPEREAREIARKEDVIVRRTAMRSETVADLVAGRINPEEAARRFAELNRMGPVTLVRVREMYPGDTDEERARWQLVAHVRAYPHPRSQFVAEQTACRLLYPAATH
jgi:hypothetical protein